MWLDIFFKAQNLLQNLHFMGFLDFFTVGIIINYDNKTTNKTIIYLTSVTTKIEIGLKRTNIIKMVAFIIEVFDFY